MFFSKVKQPRYCKYNAYSNLGIKLAESAYMDMLFDELVKIYNLPEKANPLHKRYDSVYGMMQAMETFLQTYALRVGERTDIKPMAMSEETLANLEKVFSELGMTQSKGPYFSSYDAVFCMGAAESGVRARVKELLKVVEKPEIKVKHVIALGAARKLWPLKKEGDNFSFPEPKVYDILAQRLSEKTGSKISSEDIKKQVLNMSIKETTVDKLAEEISSHPYFAGIKWPTETDLIAAILKENHKFDDVSTIFVDTPNYENGKRADSARTVQYAYKENKNIFVKDANVLVISSQPFMRNQKTIVEQNLPENVNVDVMGSYIGSSANDEQRRKKVMICIDSLARTVHAVFTKYNEKMRANSLEKTNGR